MIIQVHATDDKKEKLVHFIPPHAEITVHLFQMLYKDMHYYERNYNSIIMIK